MSAINSFVQSNAVHMMTDGLSYTPEHVPLQVDCDKCHVVEGMKAAVACTGPALLSQYMALGFSDFETFDDLVANLADASKRLFDEFATTYRDGDCIANLQLIGWLERDNCPALYSVDMAIGTKAIAWSKGLTGFQKARDDVPYFTVHRLLTQANPCPTLEQMKAADYARHFVKDYDDWVPEIDLLHTLEIQRRIMVEGRSIVGGRAMLTTVTAAGVSQRMVHTWDEDKPDEFIQPKPIDWKAWRAAKVAEKSKIDFSGLSRLQRQRMEKKAMKGTLR